MVEIIRTSIYNILPLVITDVYFSTPEDNSDASMDSMMMSQSCDLSAHVMVGNPTQQEQQNQQWSVTMDTIEPVVDMETVEHMTQLSQQLSSSAIGN